MGLAAVEVRAPRVSQVPKDVAPLGFHSQLVQPYQRPSALSDMKGANEPIFSVAAPVASEYHWRSSGSPRPFKTT